MEEEEVEVEGVHRFRPSEEEEEEEEEGAIEELDDNGFRGNRRLSHYFFIF